MFETIERLTLQPLPGFRFPSFTEKQRIVNRDGHIEVAKAYYSVPPEYLGRTVWARWDTRTVRSFDSRMHQIAVHVRSEPGWFRTDQRHIDDRKITGVERGATWLLHKADRFGTQAARWAQAMVQQCGIEGVRVLQGLVSLANKHPQKQIRRVVPARELSEKSQSLTAMWWLWLTDRFGDSAGSNPDIEPDLTVAQVDRAQLRLESTVQQYCAGTDAFGRFRQIRIAFDPLLAHLLELLAEWLLDDFVFPRNHAH